MSNYPTKTPNPVDLHVGTRVRARRRQISITQQQLAERLGLTFQQVQKYERGANRVSASKLYECARALSVEPGWFFDGLDPTGDPAKMNEDDARKHAMLQSYDMAQVAELLVGYPEPVRREATAAALGLLRAIRNVQDHHCTAGDAKPLMEHASQR